jgi:hypothetical protein
MGYHQIKLSEEESDQTAFRTKQGHCIHEAFLWVKEGPSYFSENNKHCTQWVERILMFYFHRQHNSLCRIIGKI